MRERPEQEQQPDIEAIFNNKGILPEEVMSYDKQRRVVESHLAETLVCMFSEHAESVTTNEHDVEVLILCAGSKVIRVTKGFAQDKSTLFDISIGTDKRWEHYWRLTDNSDREPCLDPWGKHLASGEILPFAATDDPEVYDPTTDFEVAFWGSRLRNELLSAVPQVPKNKSIIKKLTNRTLGKN